MRKQTRQTIGRTASAFALCFCVLLVVMIVNHYAPFGTNSLARGDASTQYLDFFNYYRDVLQGNNRITYTFGKTLGGNYLAVFAYYLSSPLNLLVVFFSQENLHAFFDWLVVLKLALAGATCAYFLDKRFPALRSVFVVLLSACYSFMQYSIAQASNVMWLDGVYMLPLVLLGVYWVIKKQRVQFLAIATALTLLFNWYSGGINCLFALFWFGLEWFLHAQEASPHWKQGGKTLLLFGLALGIGLMLSAILLLPAALTMRDGRGTIDGFGMTTRFFANPLSLFDKLIIGSKSEQDSVSLYCGSLILVGCFAFFGSGKVRVRTKMLLLVFFGLVILSLCWGPLFFLFSLMKDVTSMWSRYSYLAIFTLLFISAMFYEAFSPGPAQYRTLLKAGGLYAFLLLLFDRMNQVHELDMVALTVLLVAACTVALALLLTGQTRYTQMGKLLLPAVVIVEILCNTVLLSRLYQNKNVPDYQAYVHQQQDLLSTLRPGKDDFYRIHQTSPLNPATLNGSVSYNYPSISGYTSDPDYHQIGFLNRLGYRQNGENMCITSSVLLPADALLGVRYVLSRQPVQGLPEVRKPSEENAFYVLENPYALPFALTYRPLPMEQQGINPFEHQNQLYALLLGHNPHLYTRLEATKSADAKGLHYILPIPNHEDVLYGNIPWKQELSATLLVDGIPQGGYAAWLSPSAFQIPTQKEAAQVEITLQAEDATESIGEEQFYQLHLDRLQAATESLRKKAVTQTTWSNGYFACQLQAQAGERLYVSIPYDDGWTIVCNEKKVQPELFDDCMMSIPLEAGSNSIEMKYTAPGVWAGSILSLCGIAAVIVLWMARKRKARPGA